MFYAQCNSSQTRWLLGLMLLTVLPTLAAAAAAAPADASTKTRNVVLIVMDGLRWQEVFSGADDSLLNEKYGGIWEPEAQLRQEYWNADASKRREMLMPFIWDVVARQGQVWGNQVLHSIGQVSNPYAFSYPGYNEMSVGYPDPKINSNEYGPNPHRNVFEWLDGRPGLQHKVAIFGSWHAYKDIFNTPRNGLYIEAGANPPEGYGAKAQPASSQQRLMRRLAQTTTDMEPGDVPDSFVQVGLLDYLKTAHPRVLFVGYGETDDWAHDGRYDLVLASAHRSDSFVRELWDTMQAMPQYHDRTTFIITADHGRGSGLVEWKDHGVDQKGSENIWIAVIGPDTPPTGEQHDSPAFKQAQIAATIAALLGEDYQGAVPQAAAPLPVLSR